MMSCTPSAIDEAEQPTMASTPSLSSQRSATATPISGLFWSSATTSSIFLPLTVPPKSLIASFAAATEPGPQLSAYGPFWSFMMPILITSPETPCARSGGAASSRIPNMTAMLRKRQFSFIMGLSLRLVIRLRGSYISTSSVVLDPPASVRDEQRIERDGALAFRFQQQRIDVDFRHCVRMRDGKTRQRSDRVRRG